MSCSGLWNRLLWVVLIVVMSFLQSGTSFKAFNNCLSGVFGVYCTWNSWKTLTHWTTRLVWVVFQREAPNEHDGAARPHTGTALTFSWAVNLFVRQMCDKWKEKHVEWASVTSILSQQARGGQTGSNPQMFVCLLVNMRAWRENKGIFHDVKGEIYMSEFSGSTSDRTVWNQSVVISLI